MNQEDLYLDDDEAVKFIRNYIPQELKEKYSDDDIVYIIDLIYDFCDAKGLLDEGADEEAEIDEEELVGYVMKNAKKDGFAHFVEDDVLFIVQGEFEYEDSLDL